MLSVLFVATSLNLGLPAGLLESVCYVESTHRVKAIHHHDGHGTSYGICQIKLATAQSLGFKGTDYDLMKPSTNIYYAGLYLKKQISRYSSVKRGVIAYNYGNAKALTTTAYQRKVFRRWSTTGIVLNAAGTPVVAAEKEKQCLKRKTPLKLASK